jgi:hypothetical protein
MDKPEGIYQCEEQLEFHSPLPDVYFAVDG